MKNPIPNKLSAKRYALYAILFCLILPQVAQAQYEQHNLRSGISLTVEGTAGIDFVEEYLYHDVTMDDQKIVYIKSTAPIKLFHNERNIIAPDPAYVPSASPYATSKWYGFDGIQNSGDEYIIGTAGADEIIDSGDEGDINFRIDRFEQNFVYNKVFNPLTDPAKNQFANTRYATPFKFNELYYEPGVAVLGTIGSNNLAYGITPSYTGERYFRGMQSPFGEEVHVVTYWDNDDRILPGLSQRGHCSDGNMVFFVVNPQVPVLRLAAASGEEFYTTPLTSYHTPRILKQTTYLTSGVAIEMVNITNTKPIFYRIDSGAAIQYDRPFTLSSFNDGIHTMEYWIEGGPVKQRTFMLNPDYPSKNETHPRLLWTSGEELNYLRQKMTREPFHAAYNSFKNNLARDFVNIKIPLPTRQIWRGLIYKAYIPFHYMAPYYLESGYSVTDYPEYALLAKKALLSLMNVDFIGSESNDDFFRPSSDIYSIPNSGHNTYVCLGLGYDLAIGKFKRSDYPQGISAIEDYKIRDQLAKVEHIMLKYRENKATGGSQVGGDMHWAHGEELVAYVIAAAMPSYNTPLYGTSGFDGTEAKYNWTPYPNQILSWFQILTDPNLPTPGHPNARSPARYNYIYGTYKYFLDYPRDPAAVWDFPQDGIFWQGANGFAGATTLYELGEKDPSTLVYSSTVREMIRVPEGDLSAYAGTVNVWTLDGRKLQKEWNRSFNLPTVAAAKSGMFGVELNGYEEPFVENCALVHMIHKRLFGKDLSPNITGYFDTKLDRIAGNFNLHYLKQHGTSSAVYNYQSGQYAYPLLNNSDWLAACMPMLVHNPLMSAKVKGVLPVVKNLATHYPDFYYRKLYFSLSALIFYEDDETKYVSICYGDVSGDGIVSAYDAALIAQAAVGLISFTVDQAKAADVSGDGKVNAYDAALIAQQAVGLISKFPVEG